jgi:hypothetical protein
MSSQLEREITNLLTPMSEIRPANRARGRAVVRRHGIYGLVVLVAVLAVTIGATWAATNLTSTPRTSPQGRGQPLACLGLSGRTAGHALTVLTARGYSINWRIMHYVPPNGQQFTVRASTTAPTSAIVLSIAYAGDKSVIVFVHRAGDDLAPAAPPNVCPR